MIQDSTPCYYIYRQQMGPYIQIGLVAVASPVSYTHLPAINEGEAIHRDRTAQEIG